MVGILSVLFILALSILVIRIATVALTHTGLSRHAAAFQSRSAFTGVGFTTDEAESVVNHPVRRRIVGTLMLLGNVGIVTVVASLIVGFADVRDQSGLPWTRLGILAGGIVVLFFLGTSRYVDRWLSAVISWALDHWTRLEVRDYEELFHLSGEYGVRELLVEEQDWLADQTLGDLRLREEGANVLGVEKKNGDYVGVPRGDTRLEPGDTLLIYGRDGSLADLDERRAGAAGDSQHRQAVEEQEEVRERERREQADRERGER